MTAQQFRATKFKPDTLARIEQAAAIIAEYDGQKLTARQVFYQHVQRLLIPNTLASYKGFTSLLTDARYAGLIDWDAIEDRIREPDVPGEWESVDEIVDAAVNSFRLPRWRDQQKYVELWVEKDALAGVLAPIARRFHVPLMVNRGYSSASAMKAAADRMHAACGTDVEIECTECGGTILDGVCTGCENGKPRAYAAWRDRGKMQKDVVVLYLGDHDPSGEDMVRDIRDRLVEFGVPNLDVEKIALTRAQIGQFNPPPNPAKLTDSRARGYIEQHGAQSWELDALPPRELNRIVDRALTANTDMDLMRAVIARENAERERVRAAITKSRKGGKRK